MLGTEWFEDDLNTIIMTSTNGKIWRVNTENELRLSNIAYNGSILVAVGENIVTTEDGEKWENQEKDFLNRLGEVIWNGEQFVAVGNGIIATSADGKTWVKRMECEMPLADVVWDGKQFVVVGAWSGVIFTSTDGVTWIDRTPGEFRPLQGVAWNGKGWYNGYYYNFGRFCFLASYSIYYKWLVE